MNSGEKIERLPFIDGARGVAALVVAVGHFLRVDSMLFHGSFTHTSNLSRTVWPFWTGSEMVLLFLLISGFSLTYSEDLRRSKGTGTPLRTFARRRAWRILPVYYVAVLIGVVVTSLVTFHTSNVLFQGSKVTLGGVLSHIFLIHNLDGHWVSQGNAPLWSLAYEAQLYLLFPLLYWASRRYPIALVALCAFVLDVTCEHLGIHVFGMLRWFALGVVLARIYRRTPARWANRLLTIGLAALVIGYLRLPSMSTEKWHDLTWALAFTGIVLWMTKHPAGRVNPCTWRPLRWVGLRSYSLYALHWPLVVLIFAVGSHYAWTGRAWFPFVSVAIGLPLALLIATLSYRFVERPCVERMRATGKRHITPVVAELATSAPVGQA